MEMIDREKVIKELESLRDICNAKSNMAIGKGKVAWAGYANAAEDALALLKEHEIVRCKDCRHFREARYEDEGEPPYIKQKCGLFKYQVVPDGFCYQGERKDGDGDG